MSADSLRPGLVIDQQQALLTAASRLQREFDGQFGLLCVHNAGRSQMALGFFTRLAGEAAVAWSGGSEPGDEVDPAVVVAMGERGIDISGEFPKPWTEEIVRAADVVVTMGCGDACPVYPGKRYLDWDLDDPAGRTLREVRVVRDDIERGVRVLVDEFGIPVAET